MGDCSVIGNDAVGAVGKAADADAAPLSLQASSPVSDPDNNNNSNNACINATAESDEMDDDGDDFTSAVRVAVRIRPFLPSEAGTSGVIEVQPSNTDNDDNNNSSSSSNSNRTAVSGRSIPPSRSVDRRGRNSPTMLSTRPRMPRVICTGIPSDHW